MIVKFLLSLSTIQNLQEMHNTVGVYKPGEPDNGRQPSQPEPSKLGKGKMYNNTRKHLKHTRSYKTLVQTDNQTNHSLASQKNIVKYKTYVHYNTIQTNIPVLVQLACQTYSSGVLQP